MKIYGNKAGKVDVYEIENTLEAMQDFVGGYIEPLNLGNNLIMMFDEEARFKGKQVTTILMTPIMTIEIRGDYFVARQSGSELIGLTDSDIKYLKKKGL